MIEDAIWGEVLAELLGIEQVAVLTAAGTWGRPGEGPPGDLARGLAAAGVGRQIDVDYFASFGFIPPGDPRAPSYRQSVGYGKEETIRQIELLPVGTLIVLTGYSQGAQVVWEVAAEFLPGGRLAHRRDDLLAVVTYGNPCRPPGRTRVGNSPAGFGIAHRPDAGPELLPILMPDVVFLDYALDGDMYCTADLSTDYLWVGYAIATELQIAEPLEMFRAILAFITSNTFVKAIEELLPGNLPDELLQRVLAELTGKSPGLAELGFVKLGRTFVKLTEFVARNPHIRYADPAFAAFEGRTAVQHSIDTVASLIRARAAA